MKLPELQNSEKYVGLYVFDFGDHTSVGFAAEEIAELLESERYKDGKVYTIHRAYPDGRLELSAVPSEVFQLEAGMFFYSNDVETAKQNYKRLISLSVTSLPLCRAKVHLTSYSADKYVVALIYPAEYDDDISTWLLDAHYKTEGQVQGGTGAVERYYRAKAGILERHQLFGKSRDRTTWR